VASPNARETIAEIGAESGVAWILKPPPEPQNALQKKQRPADADAPPSLLQPH
jgi:hypothetical protein